jgi:hypothetical protein
MEMIELSEDQMDAIAGGQSSASFDVSASAAGVNVAMVTGVVNISTSDTDGSKTANITGSLTSISD